MVDFEKHRQLFIDFRNILLLDVDEIQYEQLKEFRDKLVVEIQKINFTVSKLKEQKRLLQKVRGVLVASEEDPVGSIFDMLEHNIDREISAVSPAQKEEKKLDIERRLATIQGKKKLAAFIGTIIGK